MPPRKRSSRVAAAAAAKAAKPEKPPTPPPKVKAPVPTLPDGTPIKRKRGRPRKHPRPEDIANGTWDMSASQISVGNVTSTTEAAPATTTEPQAKKAKLQDAEPTQPHSTQGASQSVSEPAPSQAVETSTAKKTAVAKVKKTAKTDSPKAKKTDSPKTKATVGADKSSDSANTVNPTAENLQQKKKTSSAVLLSPGKTSSIAASATRLPSPVKKVGRPSLVSNDISHQLTQAFASKNMPKISSILDDLKITKADQMYNELKAATDKRSKAADELIGELTKENQHLQRSVQEAMVRIAELEKYQDMATAAEEQLDEQRTILDMMEQFVGLRIHSMEDNDDEISFLCSQAGKNGVLDYKLTISKNGEEEIMYNNMSTAEDKQNLAEFMPEYFMDDLTFPVDTLQQFFHKIYRGLHK